MTTCGSASSAVLSTNLDDPQAVPYFLWDEPMTVSDLRRRLADASPSERVRLLAKVLREARDTDVWRFTTVDEVLSLWPLLARHLGVRARGAAPVAVVAVVVALGVMGRVSSVVEAGNIDGPGFDDTLDRLLEEIREPAAMVADSAEVDRRLVSAMARAAPSSRWVRVSQHSASVRQALNESRRVFAWGGSANRLEAAGWVLESPREWTVTSPARRVIRLWGLGRQAPCLIVGPAGWTDLTPLPKLTDLEELDMAKTPVKSPRPLLGLTKLKKIVVVDVKVPADGRWRTWTTRPIRENKSGILPPWWRRPGSGAGSFP